MREGLTLAALALIASSSGELQALFVHDWMWAGLLMVPVVLAAAAVLALRGGISVPVLGLLVLAAYLVHQAEEHWIDALGHRYAFRDFANAALAQLLPQSANVNPMTPFAIFVINVGVWLVALQGIFSRAGDAFPLTASAAVTVTNALAHICAYVALGIYNPGLVTAIVLFLPIAGGALIWLLRTNNARVLHVVAAFVWGVGAHAILFVGVLGANLYGLFPERVGMSFILFWMILPTAFAACARTTTV